jgi:hypothetical protein
VGAVPADGLEGPGDLGDPGEVEQANGDVRKVAHDLESVAALAGVLVFGVGGVAQWTDSMPHCPCVSPASTSEAALTAVRLRNGVVEPLEEGGTHVEITLE